MVNLFKRNVSNVETSNLNKWLLIMNYCPVKIVYLEKETLQSGLLTALKNKCSLVGFVLHCLSFPLQNNVVYKHSC